MLIEIIVNQETGDRNLCLETQRLIHEKLERDSSVDYVGHNCYEILGRHDIVTGRIMSWNDEERQENGLSVSYEVLENEEGADERKLRRLNELWNDPSVQYGEGRFMDELGLELLLLNPSVKQETYKRPPNPFSYVRDCSYL